MLHDAGHPPFSHSSEAFLKQVTGHDHEHYISQVLQQGRVPKIIESQGVRIKDVEDVIKGDFPLIGSLVAGSIDIDNIDNTLRYGVSGGIVRSPHYSPKKLVGAFRIINGRPVLHSSAHSEVEQWKRLRDNVYTLVYNDANQRGGMMLQRAIDLAYQESQITGQFFCLTDNEALHFLSEQTNSRSGSLINDAINRDFTTKFYPGQILLPCPIKLIKNTSIIGGVEGY